MRIRITVSSTMNNGELVSINECEEEGDLKNAISAILDSFRAQFPQTPPFEWRLNVEKD